MTSEGEKIIPKNGKLQILECLRRLYFNFVLLHLHLQYKPYKNVSIFSSIAFIFCYIVSANERAQSRWTSFKAWYQNPRYLFSHWLTQSHHWTFRRISNKLGSDFFGNTHQLKTDDPSFRTREVTVVKHLFFEKHEPGHHPTPAQQQQQQCV